MSRKRRKRDPSFRAAAGRKYRRMFEQPKFVIAPLLLIGSYAFFSLLQTFASPPSEDPNWRFNDRETKQSILVLRVVPAILAKLGMSLWVIRIVLAFVAAASFGGIGLLVWLAIRDRTRRPTEETV